MYCGGNVMPVGRVTPDGRVKMVPVGTPLIPVTGNENPEVGVIWNGLMNTTIITI